MLSESIRILDFDRSVASQPRLISRYRPEIIDLSSLAPLARLWMNKNIKRKIEARISGLSKNALTFIGSGDFHHISSVLISRFTEPLTLIVFDFHPDWEILPPRFGCGSWVSRALEQKNILKIVLIGPSSDDLSGWRAHSGSLAALADNRVEIYPYARRPSSVFLKKIPENISLKTKPGFLHSKIYWEELGGKGLEDFFRSLLKRLPAQQVYLSLDKDCLKKEYALTNWEEGKFSLDELLGLLKAIKENLDIVGMDITGDFSPVYIKGKIKSFFSKLDHPKDIPANRCTAGEIRDTNEATNLKILETLGL